MEADKIDSAIRFSLAMIRAGDPSGALAMIRGGATPNDPIARQMQYSKIGRAIGEALPELPALRVAFLASSTIDHLVDCLRFWLLLEGIRLEPYIAPFNTWRQEVTNPTSGLYACRPDIVWFFLTARDLHFETIPDANVVNSDGIVSSKVQEIVSFAGMVMSALSSYVVINNAEASSNRLFGNFEGTATWSFTTLLRRYNLQLAASLPSGATIFDLDYQASRFGLNRWEEPRLWYHSKHPFSLEAHGPVAFSGAKLLSAFRGQARKCVVLDLDNTLWGGVVGDDGVDGICIGTDSGSAGEAFADFQMYLKKLSRRGIALAVCSKNDPELAKEPFRKRHGMVLKLDDFAVFRANWENKADNLRSIAQEMNIGLNSLALVDDNPAERALVRAEIPEIAVPEMPLDPAEYISTLAGGGWFETVSFSAEDRNRSRTYQENAARQAVLSQVTDLDAYLCDLSMHATWGAVDSGKLGRVTQLVNKTNQFHLTTTRYSEPEMSELMVAEDAWCGWFSLSDRFGDNGVIAVVVLRFLDGAALVDTWAMSCRVFSRGMEDFIFLKIWEVAKAHGCSGLVGIFRPTPKNGVVAALYDRLGGHPFCVSETEKRWQFDLADTPRLTHFIADNTK